MVFCCDPPVDAQGAKPHFVELRRLLRRKSAKGREDNRGFAREEPGNLIAERLAGPRWHQAEGVTSRDKVCDHLRLRVTERTQTKDRFEKSLRGLHFGVQSNFCEAVKNVMGDKCADLLLLELANLVKKCLGVNKSVMVIKLDSHRSEGGFEPAIKAKAVECEKSIRIPKVRVFGELSG